MKVAIYLDREDDVAEKCIASVRKHMPHAEIWHLTTLNGPHLSADKCLRVDVEGTFGYKRPFLHSMMEGETLFIDSDVIVTEDVSHVFDEEFDVALTTDMKPGADGIKYNGGVSFSRCPEYWIALAELGKSLDFGVTDGDWENAEKSLATIADSRKFHVKTLPGEQYNYIPEYPEDLAGKLVHFRGGRKNWMLPIKEFKSGLNTAMETMIHQAIQNMALNTEFFAEKQQNDETAIIVGGGPSLAETLMSLRFSKGKIFALNGAHDWLIERGLTPDYMVMLDARPENLRFVSKPDENVTYLISSQCHPSIFRALNGYKVIQWVSCTDTPENDQEIAKHFPGQPITMVGGGATVGMKAMYLAYLMGHVTFDFHGMDSSYRGSENHAYKQPLNDDEEVLEVFAGPNRFMAAPWMIKQAKEFVGQAKKLIELGCDIRVYGNGLLPTLWSMTIAKADEISHNMEAKRERYFPANSTT